jgi:hypothetical protein
VRVLLKISFTLYVCISLKYFGLLVPFHGFHVFAKYCGLLFIFCCVILPCMNMPQCICPLPCWWTFEVFIFFLLSSPKCRNEDDTQPKVQLIHSGSRSRYRALVQLTVSQSSGTNLHYHSNGQSLLSLQSLLGIVRLWNFCKFNGGGVIFPWGHNFDLTINEVGHLFIGNLLSSEMSVPTFSLFFYWVACLVLLNL